MTSSRICFSIPIVLLLNRLPSFRTEQQLLSSESFMSSCGKAFVTPFHMFSSKLVDYLWAHVMPPLKPIFRSLHPSWGDSLKQKLLGSNSFLELVNQAHEEEICQSCDQQAPLAVLLETVSVFQINSLVSSYKTRNNFPFRYKSHKQALRF